MSHEVLDGMARPGLRGHGPRRCRAWHAKLKMLVSLRTTPCWLLVPIERLINLWGWNMTVRVEENRFVVLAEPYTSRASSLSSHTRVLIPIQSEFNIRLRWVVTIVTPFTYSDALSCYRGFVVSTISGASLHHSYLLICSCRNSSN